MYAFDLVTPRSVEDALAALKQEDAQPLAGGQTLIPTLKSRLAQPAVLVSLNHVEGLRHVRRTGDVLEIGAMTTHGQIAAEAGDIPGLVTLASMVGDPAVRNRGTIGGSLANNDPSACYPAAALALNATIVTSNREIAADDFFQGMFTTALEEGELITAIRLPVPQASSYQKFPQPASRFPLVGVFAARFAEGTRIAVTGASEEGVFRWTQAEADPDNVDGAEGPDVPMLVDLQADAAYRKHMVKVMTKRALAAL